MCHCSCSLSTLPGLMRWQGWGMAKEGVGGEAFWFSLPAGSKNREECSFKHLEPPELPCLPPACSASTQ